MELPYSRIASKSTIDPLVRVYLFEGKEDALKQEALAKLTAQVVDQAFADFDTEVFEGDSATAQRVLGAAGAPPFGSPKRLVVVKRANDIPSSEQEAIAEKLAGLPESAALVFIAPAPELKDGRPKGGSNVIAKFAKAVGEAGAVITFAGLRAEDAAQVVAAKFSAAGKKIDSRAARRLVDRVGSDLSILATEIRKLIDFSGDKDVITVEDVDFVTEQAPEERIWNLLDAVGARNLPEALRLLKQVLESGGRIEGEAPRLLAMLLRQLRFIWQVRSLQEMGERLGQPSDKAMEALPSENNVVVFLRRAQFQAQRLQAQAKNFTLSELEQCFEYAASADLAVKGAEGEIEDAIVILELLIINLCRRRRTTQTRDNQ
jgi:DNA polymerase III subunit delta